MSCLISFSASSSFKERETSKKGLRVKVAYTSGPNFEKKKEAVPHIFYTNNLRSDWSNAQIKHIIGIILF